VAPSAAPRRAGLAALALALALATAAARHVGRAELAGHQIAAQLFLFLAIGVDMFKVSGQALVGNALRADDPVVAREVVSHLYGWAWRSGSMLTVLTLVSAPVLPRVFADDPDVRRAATVALVVLGLMQVPAAVTFVLDGVLMGANDFRALRWQTTLAFVVVAPIFVAVMVWPSLGIVTVWIGMAAWVVVRAVKNHLRVRGDRWLSSAASVR
jgi:Na+-driven multidrug efflux pump